MGLALPPTMVAGIRSATSVAPLLDLPAMLGRQAARLQESLEEAGRYLPSRVRRTLEKVALCGDPRRGFAWLLCGPCDVHKLVAHSCKVRVICGRCGGRRMATTAAHLVDRVFPHVAVRQWVLTVPWPRRRLLARKPELARGVLSVMLNTVFAWQAKRSGKVGAQGGSVTATQRFSSDLRLNLHFHALVLDGVYVEDPKTGRLRFWRDEGPRTADVEELVVLVAKKCEAWLARRGHGVEGTAGDEDHDPGDAQQLIQAASVAGRSAVARGRRARRVQVHGGREYKLPPRCATYNGYNLHAGVIIGAKDREGLERLARYACRAAISKERLHVLPNGDIELELKRSWSDGTGAIRMTELELTERIAALVPPPKSHGIHYHGVLASRHRYRSRVVPKPPKRTDAKTLTKSMKRSASSTWVPWSELLRRVFEKDGFQCPVCGEQMSVRAVVLPPGAVRVVAGLEAAQARGSPDGGPRIIPT